MKRLNLNPTLFERMHRTIRVQMHDDEGRIYFYPLDLKKDLLQDKDKPGTFDVDGKTYVYDPQKVEIHNNKHPYVNYVEGCSVPYRLMSTNQNGDNTTIPSYSDAQRLHDILGFNFLNKAFGSGTVNTILAFLIGVAGIIGIIIGRFIP